MREEERIENLLQAAISSLQVGDASTTGDACGAILELDHAHPEAHFILGLSFFKCGNVESARQYLIAGLDSHSPNSVVLAPVIRALDALGETESTLRACNSYLEQHPADVETLLIRARQWSLQKHVGQAISDCETALAHAPGHAAALDLLCGINELLTTVLKPQVETRTADQSNPSILLAGQSASASVYICGEVQKYAEVPPAWVHLTAGDYYDAKIVRNQLDELVECRGIKTCHLFASHENLLCLEVSGIRKVWAHVRDPRQVTLSMLKYWTMRHSACVGDSSKEGEYERRLIESFFPPGFYELPFEQQIDEALKSYYPHAMAFSSQWLAATEDPQWSFEILLTTFEQFKMERVVFYQRVLDFYNLDYEQSPFPEQEVREEEQSVTYYRKGQLDEFRSVFSPEQLERANAMLPPELREYFKWSL